MPTRWAARLAASSVSYKLSTRSAAPGYLLSSVWGAVASRNSARAPGRRTPSRLPGSLEQCRRSFQPPAGAGGAAASRRRISVDLPHPGPALMSQGVWCGSSAAARNQPRKPEGASAPRKKSSTGVFCIADPLLLRYLRHRMRGAAGR